MTASLITWTYTNVHIYKKLKPVLIRCRHGAVKIGLRKARVTQGDGEEDIGPDNEAAMLREVLKSVRELKKDMGGVSKNLGIVRESVTEKWKGSIKDMVKLSSQHLEVEDIPTTQ